MILPGDYVTEHVELAYAATFAAAQGRTVDTRHVVWAMGMDRESLYVGLTRGRDANHAYLVTEDFLHDEFGGGSIEPVDAVRAIIDQDPNVTSATDALRDDLADADSLAAWGPIADDLDTAVTSREDRAPATPIGIVSLADGRRRRRTVGAVAEQLTGLTHLGDTPVGVLAASLGAAAVLRRSAAAQLDASFASAARG